jgi:hypothetical protein
MRVVADLVKLESQRNEQLGFKTVRHPGGQHPDYGLGFAVQPEMLAMIGAFLPKRSRGSR